MALVKASPVLDPSRTKPLRAGLAYIFPELVNQTRNPGYNPRATNNTLWSKLQGWFGSPSRHSYTAAFDVMLNTLTHPDGQRYTYMEAVSLGNRVADWAVKVATDKRYENANAEYGRIVEVIWNQRIWTRSRGWHPYSGVSKHLDHVHIGLHCPEMKDPG